MRQTTNNNIDPKKKGDIIFPELLNSPTDTSREIEKIANDISVCNKDLESICSKINFQTNLPSLAEKGKIVSPAASVSEKFHYEEGGLSRSFFIV
ncbi:hypothetical protein EG68_08326 [Paragonimus skrjabini miyazakii]|uniref:Uncharacterized protein n=1 Tax=Paragonimus skrjabini miyazakii TaxID=59628 RepID=A0A8S9YIL2_9TREM|nr:hypothetical protein EG68_08326 [Paragonimus skrjabini miyazakii]